MPFYSGDLSKYHKNLENIIRHFGVLLSYLTLDIDLDNLPDRKIPVKFTKASSIYEAYMNDKEKIKALFPIITYQVIDIKYQGNLNNNNLLKAKKFGTDADNHTYRYLNAPYRALLKVSIMSTNLGHLYQLIEQILPAFTPTVMKCDIEEIFKYEPFFDKYNFTYQDVSFLTKDSQYYPSYLEDVHVAELTFTVDFIMYAKTIKTHSADIIKEIFVKFFSDLDLSEEPDLILIKPEE